MIEATLTYRDRSRQVVEAAMNDCGDRGSYWSFEVLEFGIYAECGTSVAEKGNAQDAAFRRLCELGYEGEWCQITVTDGIRPGEPYTRLLKIESF